MTPSLQHLSDFTPDQNGIRFVVRECAHAYSGWGIWAAVPDHFHWNRLAICQTQTMAELVRDACERAANPPCVCQP